MHQLYNYLRRKKLPIPLQDSGVSSITPIKSIYYAIKVGLAVMLACIFKNREVEE